MEKNKKVAVTLGLEGFPYGMASSQKLLMMGKAIVEGGMDFKVISNTFVKKNELNKELKQSDEIEGVQYITTSPYVFSPNSKIKKAHGKIMGWVNEFLHVNKILNKQKSCAFFLYSPNFLYLFFWSLYLKLRKKKRFLIYYELRSEAVNRKKITYRINDWFVDNYSFSIIDGIVTISEYLIEHIKNKKPSLPILKLPPIVDFKEFESQNQENESSKEKYFLFCGNIGYIEIIDFIVEAFSSVKDEFNDVKLYLLVNGDQKHFDYLNNKLRELKIEEKVKIMSGVDKQELIKLYINAYALLIPIRDNLQDIARFPHKIAEYCAAKRPIISCKMGEVGYYFNDESAFLTKKYDVEEFSQQMIMALSDTERANSKAERAYHVGLKYFDYRSYSNILTSFIK